MIRQTLFWLHLVVGVAAGILIAVMSFTGAALTFEKEIIAWAERDARRVDVPANAGRLPLEDILQRARAAQPGFAAASTTVSADPRDAVLLGGTRNKTVAVNPYTGEVREPQAPRTRAFMLTMRKWHTRLNVNATGPGNWGARLNSVANAGLVVLTLTGLVLWWPRRWTWSAIRPSLWFNRAQGRARDWNWHNVVGFWSLPLLLVLAGSGVVLSYRWAGDLVFVLAGEKPPERSGPPAAAAGTSPRNESAAPATAPVAVLGPDALLSAVQKAAPGWESITLRFTPPLGSPGLPRPGAKPVGATVKEKDSWPPFAVKSLVLDSTSGEVKRTDTFEALSTGTRARRWIRLLHSGEALGTFVQFLSGVACLGGCVLVYTGFALAWRRFFERPV